MKNSSLTYCKNEKLARAKSVQTINSQAITRPDDFQSHSFGQKD